MTPGELLHTLLSKHGAARYCAEWGDLSDQERADLEEAAEAVFGAERQRCAKIANDPIYGTTGRAIAVAIQARG